MVNDNFWISVRDTERKLFNGMQIHCDGLWSKLSEVQDIWDKISVTLVQMLGNKPYVLDKRKLEINKVQNNGTPL